MIEQQTVYSRQGERTSETRRRIDPSKRKPLAIDLSVEQQHIQEQGMAYVSLFLENMRSFAKETDTPTEQFSFKHLIRRDSVTGQVTLTYESEEMVFEDSIEPTKESKFSNLRRPMPGGAMYPKGTRTVEYIAREQYLKAALDESLPDWDRDRHMREYQAVVSLEQMLESASRGTTFVEGSNAPFDRDEEDLEGTFYGEFSFYRMHTVAEDKHGREVLEGSALKHYLDWETQTELFTLLTQDTDVTPETLLGTMRELHPSKDFEDVTSIEDLAEIIKGISPEYKCGPESQEERVRSDADIDAFIRQTDPMMMEVFKLLHRDKPGDKEKALQAIKEWRLMIRQYCDGNEDVQRLVDMYSTQKTRNVAREAISSSYGAAVLTERYNSCGSGIGFGQQGVSVEKITGIPSHKMLAEYKAQVKEVIKAAEKGNEPIYCLPCPSSKDHSKFPTGKFVLFTKGILRRQKLVCPCNACATCDLEGMISKARKAPPKLVNVYRQLQAA